MNSVVPYPDTNPGLWGRMLSALARAPQWFTHAYYALFKPAMVREERAVFAGMISYHAAERRIGTNRYLLRRNIHRIEKGLMMQPRRDVFGVHFIGETFKVYQAYVKAFGHPECADMDEWRWAHDVLSEYFSVTASHPTIDPLREQFSRLEKPQEQAARNMPYVRDLSASPVDFASFAALAKRRRSVRWFLDKQVPRELIDQALTAAFESPSACNRQPFVFRIFDDRARAKEVLGIPAGTRGWGDDVPMAIAVVGQLKAFFNPQDRHLIYIDSSLAVMSFMFALETQGLSSCSINFPDSKNQETKARKILGLAPDERVIMLLAVGYPDPERQVAFSHKRSLDELRRYND